MAQHVGNDASCIGATEFEISDQDTGDNAYTVSPATSLEYARAYIMHYYV
jgi:hypothetical protein